MEKNLKKKLDGFFYAATGVKSEITMNVTIDGVIVFYAGWCGAGATLKEAVIDMIHNTR